MDTNWTILDPAEADPFERTMISMGDGMLTLRQAGEEGTDHSVLIPLESIGKLEEAIADFKALYAVLG